MTIRAIAAGAFIFLGAVSAAAAQPQPSQDDRARERGELATKIEETARDVAEAAGAIAEAFWGAAEKLAVGSCRARAARYGQVSVSEVRPKGDRRLRVRGVIDPSRRFEETAPRAERAYPRRSFTCLVEYDGSIRSFKTKRLRG